VTYSDYDHVLSGPTPLISSDDDGNYELTGGDFELAPAFSVNISFAKSFSFALVFIAVLLILF